ncbi:MAG: sugar transferase [Pseudomonadota bacterium]
MNAPVSFGKSHPVFATPRALSTSPYKPGFYARFGKRLFETALVLASLPLVLPLICVMAGLVALNGGQPFFFQPRITRSGKFFRLVKMRTMCVDAERVLEDKLSSCSKSKAEWDHYQKLQDDPRITPIGSFLRKSSLDELPQLWHVLTGEMALIGPRPMMPSQIGLYQGAAYFRTRPGITGLWQVSRRNEGGFAERATMDKLYLDRMSFAQDIAIIFRTLKVMSKGTGV